jgi:hypothetical protein
MLRDYQNDCLDAILKNYVEGVDSVLVELTKRAPQTVAEKEFHKWIVGWKKKLEDKNHA